MKLLKLVIKKAFDFDAAAADTNAALSLFSVQICNCLWHLRQGNPLLIPQRGNSGFRKAQRQKQVQINRETYK